MFSLAYALSQQEADEFALFHYRAVLGLDPDLQMTLNNAGVAAERLGMRVSAVHYYKRSEAAGGSLSSANLGNLLIQAGFLADATTLLDKAKATHGNQTHRNVIMRIGDIATAEQADDDKMKPLTTRAQKVSEWMTRSAVALLRPDSGVTGSFSNDSISLELGADGVVSGIGKGFSTAGDAVISGRIRGDFVNFEWSTPQGTNHPWSSSKIGHGRAVLAPGPQLVGYYYEGLNQLDSAGSDGWQEFTLIPPGPA